MQKISIFIIEKFKNTASAQLCSDPSTLDAMRPSCVLYVKDQRVCVCVCVCVCPFNGMTYFHRPENFK